MSYNLGLNLVEVDGKVAPSIQPAATSRAGFSIFAERGVPGSVTRVTNWTEFTAHFGGYMPAYNGAYTVRGFFDNGGATAFVTRVVNAVQGVDDPAEITTSDGPWTVADGDSITFESGPVVTFASAGPATITGGGTAFGVVGQDVSIIVNGGSPRTYVFSGVSGEDFADPSAPTLAEAVNALNREFGHVRIFVDSGNIVVATDELGTDATLEISGTGATTLGIATAEVPGTGNVDDPAAITVEEARQAFDAALTGAGFTVTIAGDALVIQHPASINIADASAAVAGAFGLDADDHTSTPGDGSAAVAAVAARAPLGSLQVTAGRRGSQDPGAWGNALSVTARAQLDGGSPVLDGSGNAVFDLSVTLAGAEVEAWTGLVMASDDTEFVADIINDSNTGSKYITVTTDGSANLPTDGQPDDTITAALVDGDNGTFANEDAAPGAAIAASFDLFALAPIQLLTSPESTDEGMMMAGLSHCANAGDRMFVGHTPQGFDAAATQAWSQTFRANKVYGALYFPWIHVLDPRTARRRWIPPTGHVLGVYARTDRERGIWKAPAGVQASLNGAVDVEFHMTDTTHTALVKEGAVNAVRYVAGQGIIVDSSRTLSSNSLWLYVNVRLLFNFVKSSLIGGLRWAVQEPNDATLWNKIKFNSVTPFLMGLWRLGAFGSGSPDEVFSVKIDSENNPSDAVSTGRLTLEVYFYPSRPAETIVIIVGQQEGGGSASEG